jgi:glycosidase
MSLRIFASLFLASVALAACAQPPSSPKAATAPATVAPSMVRIKPPAWANDAVIYQINTRQFTPEGTFKAAQAQLSRLKELGVEIVWLMPVHPIGEKNRKGTLGSPYSVKDYYGVNPEFGTLEDLKAFVAAAHALDLKVIIDWVANHTAWDNPLVTQHPDWYVKNWKGEYKSTPWTDWADIIDLDYANPAVRTYMEDAMAYWVREVGVDGFRCDVAGFVPLDFWEKVRARLDAIKPVFMLGEGDMRDLHYAAFDATYAWDWNNTLHNIAMGRAEAGAMGGFYYGHHGTFPPEALRMMHISNHDQNAWDATARERFGPATDAAIVLSVVSEGIPMMYNGQEAGDPKRLQFFEKDPIPWRKDPMEDLYRQLFALKKSNGALWNAPWGARMIGVVNSQPKSVFSFVRQNEKDKVFVAVNLSARPVRVGFVDGLHHGAYVEYFSREAMTFDANTEVAMPAWSYRVYVRPSSAPG